MSTEWTKSLDEFLRHPPTIQSASDGNLSNNEQVKKLEYQKLADIIQAETKGIPRFFFGVRHKTDKTT